MKIERLASRCSRPTKAIFLCCWWTCLAHRHHYPRILRTSLVEMSLGEPPGRATGHMFEDSLSSMSRVVDGSRQTQVVHAPKAVWMS